MAFLDFDPNAQAPADFDLLAAGWYIAEIRKSEMKETNAGDGQYLSLGLIIATPSGGEKWVFDNLNIDNPNPKAEAIAKGTLSAICHAVGLTEKLEDSEDLHGIPLAIKVKTIPAKGEYEAKNGIRKYAAVDDDCVKDLVFGGGKKAPAKTKEPAKEPAKDGENKAPAEESAPWGG